MKSLKLRIFVSVLLALWNAWLLNRILLAMDLASDGIFVLALASLFVVAAVDVFVIEKLWCGRKIYRGDETDDESKSNAATSVGTGNAGDTVR